MKSTGIEPLLTEADHKRTGEATENTYAKLHAVAEAEGIASAVAEGVGTMFGVAHFFGAIGLQKMFRQLSISVRKYADSQKSTGVPGAGKKA